MTEQPFEVPVEDGVLVGHRGGEGPPALVLGGPYTIESHSADALPVLDQFGIERAWAVGHSWGGHLALHLAATRPDRLLGAILVDPLGAYGDVFEEAGENLLRDLRPEDRARVLEVEALRGRGEATDEMLYERFTLLWPQYFADPAAVVEPPARVGSESSTGTNASIAEHFQRGTLIRGLPEVRLPALFVHGVLDPLPLWSVERTSALIPGARLETIPACGHFPWWERPGEIRRIVGEFVVGQS